MYLCSFAHLCECVCMCVIFNKFGSSLLTMCRKKVQAEKKSSIITRCVLRKRCALLLIKFQLHHFYRGLVLISFFFRALIKLKNNRETHSVPQVQFRK